MLSSTHSQNGDETAPATTRPGAGGRSHATPLPTALAGAALLGHRMLTKDLAFTDEERDAFGLRGLLPARVLTIEEQVELELEHLRRKHDDLERYIGLTALQDRNATLFYRLLAEHIEEFLPILYTPTVGRAAQEFSHIIRRTRGLWLTPPDIDRIPDLLRNAPYENVRLMVVTDNERILGLGDLGAGGMAIPLGKLALYTAAGGIDPSVTLPVSLDVGTDNQQLLDDPMYVGYRRHRLRGADYLAFIDAFVAAVETVFPGCVIQWEDFKQASALAVLDRYRHRVPSFNDDVQGTAVVVLGGLLAAMRHLRHDLPHQRVLIVGAGGAGIGIARLLELAMGRRDQYGPPHLALADSRGLIHDGRDDLDPTKRAFAVTLDALPGTAVGEPIDLAASVSAFQPTVLVGATGVAGTFTESAVRAMAEQTSRPIILPLSNPTSVAEATPDDLLHWTDGRALVATGSPFEPVMRRGHRHVIGQANNVFVFPGLGLGAMVVGATAITDRMLLRAADVLADHVSVARFSEGALYPPIRDLRVVSRAVATAVATEAVKGRGARRPSMARLARKIDAAIWWPEYRPYVAMPRPAR